MKVDNITWLYYPTFEVVMYLHVVINRETETHPQQNVKNMSIS